MLKNTLKATTLLSTVIMSVGVCAPVKSDGATVNSDVNVREGASTEYNVTGTLTGGEKVEILSESNGWYKIKDENNETGWSYGKYINASDEESQNASNDSSTSTKNSGTVNVNLNFRKGPSTDEEIIKVFQQGEELRIVSQQDGWYEVENSEGQTGWCYGKYVNVSGDLTNVPNKTTSKEDTQESEQASDDTNGTFKNTANVRKGASTKYAVIDTLKAGQKVKVISSLDGWYKIKCPNGQVGWTHSSQIDSSVKVLYSTSEKSSSSDKQSQSNSSNQETSTSQSSSSQSSSSSKSGKQMVVSATAYSGDSITSTGTRPKWGTIAVDPSVIPYGTKVYIPRFGQTFIAEDCGGAIKGNRIDIFMNSESECNSWGRRSITIEILD